MDEKDILARYLRAAREGLVWKTEGLSERDLRLPRTSTGTSLLGLVKHCAGVEAEYFGACLGREHGMPWWGEAGETTFRRLLVHVLYDVSRHAGQADILREAIDGATGMTPSLSNVWEPEGGWPAHVAKLQGIADAFSES